MTDDNRYVKRGHSSILDDRGIQEQEPWDFEQEAWDVAPIEPSGEILCKEGLSAAVEHLGLFKECYVARIELQRPRLPVDNPRQLLDSFPAVWTYPKWKIWLLGFSQFSINRETGCREVTVYTQTDLVQAHLREPPDSRIMYRHKYYILEKIDLPDWIQEHM